MRFALVPRLHCAWLSKLSPRLETGVGVTRPIWREIKQDTSANSRRRRVAVLAVSGTAVALAVAVTGTLAATGATTGRGLPAAGRAHPLSPVRIQPGVQAGKATITAPGGGLTPAQVAVAYDLGPLTSAGITGAGQTIVIVDSFGSPTIGRDLAHFDSFFKLPPPPSFRVIQPAGKVPAFHAGNSNRVGWAEETTLDVEWAHAIAPGASIVLAETPTSENEGTSGFPQIVTAEKYVLRHKLGQVISQSFAATEQTFPSKSSLRALRGAYQLAARDHVTVLAATGDEGATSFKYNMQDLYTSRAVSWPATDPLVTAVGGTQLHLRADGTRRSADVAWRDSAGGRSIVFGRPSYQKRARAQTRNARGVPDISMDASCASSVAIFSSFSGEPGQWEPLCGTSLATPLFAGIVALADQYAGHGKARSLGLINPAIYAIAARHERGIVDIRRGSNTETFSQGGKRHTVKGFSARAGYDLVTGVGTIDAAYFVPELAKLAG
jgi:subtilase family serine protease